MNRTFFLTMTFLLIASSAQALSVGGTDVMGGGTPGREDKNRMSKKMYGYTDETKGQKKAQNLNEKQEEQKNRDESKSSQLSEKNAPVEN